LIGDDADQVLALLLALWDLETAAGASMFHWNFGNVIATRPDSQLFYVADDSGNTRKFRAYNDANDGARGLVQQLTSSTRPEWHTGLLTGDPNAFVRALSGADGGPAYFEADPERYRRTFLERWRKYSPKAEPPNRGPTTTRKPIPLLAPLGVVTLAYLLWRWGRTGRR
jgi:hypothetical protein